MLKSTYLNSPRYGYTPLPKIIPKNLFDDKMKHLTEHEITLANQWYTLDENAIPNEYILQNLTSIDDSSYWGTALPSLLRAFDGIRFDGEDNVTDQDGHLLIGQSVTEWEV